MSMLHKTIIHESLIPLLIGIFIKELFREFGGVGVFFRAQPEKKHSNTHFSDRFNIKSDHHVPRVINLQIAANNDA
jgi:hypothetical protein